MTAPRVFLLVLLLSAARVPAAEAGAAWDSAATGGSVAARVLVPPAGRADAAAPRATVIYLTNLAIPRLGQEADDAILADLLAGDHQVIVLDYARHPKAVSPDLNADVLKLRRDLADKKLAGERPIDPAQKARLIKEYAVDEDLYREQPAISLNGHRG